VRPIITLLATVVLLLFLAAPLAADARQAPRRTIGFLAAGSAATTSDEILASSQRLHELGWIEGRNIAIDYRYADGLAERFEELATQFVAEKVDVIVT
jgi:ABC-type uncharacterized transport system substrate-binding protein